MTTFNYQSAGNNVITFGSLINPDHLFKVGAQRKWADSSASTRIVSLLFKENSVSYMSKPECPDACKVKAREALTSNFTLPMPYTEADKTALIARVTAFHNNVIKALRDYNVASSNLPPTSATFDGTIV